MKKVFISQPMKGKTNEEIEHERQKIKFMLDEELGIGNYEVIDSFFKGAPHEAKPLWFLGKSLELLSTADLAVFAEGWKQARGCSIEHECCKEYDVPIWEM